ncbi:PepSY-associated TM helix domain-containing protein [Methylophilus aquaticus]|uniref:PepSY-associated TM helix domain-containing protein n=1 Tax=Methylophilus aquaticus TaxID=1971610 RepID=A0ABT9JV46_9PROT|nr:PepSY-associated TM helix domain-containing protein [Methylophilus aquaticus]MDP8568001.1 PepSY-associated TM helix domain-containing protein [Methylophilus aquaticus]
MLMNIRHYGVRLHRYAGLTIALFLVVAGVTGAVIAFYDPLDQMMNPQLYEVSDGDKRRQVIDPLVLRERLLATYPEIQIQWVPLRPAEGQAIRFSITPAINPSTGAPYQLAYDELFVNPYTGNTQGRRMSGNISDGVENLVPFMLKLHSQLALGQVGAYLMGVIGLLWTIDCFIGACLTFPRKTRQPSPKKNKVSQFFIWLKRWLPAWKLRIYSTNRYKLNFDLHRALGLWTWAMLFVLAWSSVAFNLNREVYQPVMHLLFETQKIRPALIRQLQPNYHPQLSYADARSAATTYLNASNPLHLRQVQPFGMSYLPKLSVYQYRFVSNRDIRSSRGNTRLFIHADTGEIVDVYIPLGKTSGDTFTTWMRTLHMADCWGIPFKMFISVMGIVVSMLSVTGLVIWSRKRQARR